MIAIMIAIMNKELVENEGDTMAYAAVGEGREQKDGVALSYAGYVREGGLINETDYQNALTRVRDSDVNVGARQQAEGIAKFSGIDLDLLRSDVDPRALYGVLRNDTAPEEIVHHHDQMSDQRLFVEMLRMLEEGEAVRLVKNAYPHIFK